MESGSFSKITKPDFIKITRKEFKKYILSHPTDDEVIRELFINCRNPHLQVFPYSQNMSYEEVEAMFKSKLNLDP